MEHNNNKQTKIQGPSDGIVGEAFDDGKTEKCTKNTKSMMNRAWENQKLMMLMCCCGGSLQATVKNTWKNAFYLERDCELDCQCGYRFIW